MYGGRYRPRGQRVDGPPVAAARVDGRPERVEHRLLGRVDGRLEEPVELARPRIVRSSDVANAMKISPLPWCATEPARASPSPTRRARRSRSCGESGASVATTPMQLPAGFCRWSGGTSAGRPDAVDAELLGDAEVREQQHADRVLARRGGSRCRCRPSSRSSSCRRRRRPRLARSRGVAAATACRDVARPGRAAMRASESQLSSHSPTTGITTSSTPTRGSAAIATCTAPSYTRPTACVDVR